MRVKRIVANLPAADPSGTAAFYRDILGLELVMDMGWIATYAGADPAPVQVTLAAEGGAGTPLPAISIEVDDLDAALARVEASGIAIEYGPVDEPWGVRRFFVRDPAGNLVNILSHR